MERMRTWTSIHSSQRYIYVYIYVCVYVYNCHVFNICKSKFRKTNFKARNHPIYIYTYISVCLSVYTHWRSWHFQKFIRRNDLCSMLISVRSLLRHCCLSAQYSFRLCASLRHPISFDKIERNEKRLARKKERKKKKKKITYETKETRRAKVVENGWGREERIARTTYRDASRFLLSNSSLTPPSSHVPFHAPLFASSLQTLCRKKKIIKTKTKKYPVIPSLVPRFTPR